MAAENDDLLGSEPPRGDHPTEPDSAVSDDGHRLAGTDLRAESRVVPGRHHVREREQRRHQLVVGADRKDNERSVRLWDTDRFALSAVHAVEAVPPAVQAGGLQPGAAEDAGAVRPDERRDDEVALLERAHVRADVLDDADELVPHAPAVLVRLHRLVRPQIAAADRRARDANDGVGSLDEACVGDVLDANVAGAVHEGRAHVLHLPENRRV